MNTASGADLNITCGIPELSRSVLYAAVSAGTPAGNECAQWLMDDGGVDLNPVGGGSDCRPLNAAVRTGNVELLQAMLSKVCLPALNCLP